MSQNIEINKLIQFIEKKQDFNIIRSNSCFYNNHLGAVLTDIVLQAGLNYKTVVLPRVLRVYKDYNDAYDLTSLINTIDDIGLERFLNWKNQIKLKRFESIIEYLIENSIQTTNELLIHLNKESNLKSFLSVQGIGNKTVDYFFKLMHIETIAVDRHIINFLHQAEVNFNNYHSAKKIVEFTADMLNVSRRDIDYSIWNYMSGSSLHNSLELNF
jgi:endonuclease III